MAGAGYVIKTGITFDTKSAQRELKKMAEVLNEIIEKRNKMAEQANQANQSGDADSEKYYRKEVKRLDGLWKAQERQIKSYQSSVERIQESMSGLSGRTLKELQAIEKETLTAMNGLRVGKDKKSVEWADALARHLRNVRNEMANIRSGFPDLENQMKNYTKMSIDGLERLRERLKSNRNAMSENTDGTFNKQKYAEIGSAIQGINVQIQKLKGLTGVMRDLVNASPEQLQSALIIYQDMVKTGELNNAQLKEATYNIKTLQNQMKWNAEKTIKSVNGGSFKGTLEDTKKAVESIRQYRQQLNPDTTPRTIFDNIDKALDSLNQKMKQYEAGYISSSDAMKKAGEVQTGTWKGTEEELRRVKTALEEYKRTINTSDESGRKKFADVESKILSVEQAIKGTVMTEKEFSNITQNLRTMPYDKLKAAAERLKNELQRMSMKQGEYNEKAMKLRTVQGQIEKIEKSWKNHTSALANAYSRLKSYVLIYVGFQQVVSKMQEATSGIMELSDQMANVRKVTNMSLEGVKMLVDNLQSIDSRTSTAELMQFAEQAGKLGIYSQQGAQGMQQFVEMGERISKTLGEDIGGAEAIASLAKINSILGETNHVMEITGNRSTVMRDALNATGSAILNVGNNSAASYAAIVNYTKRLGAIGSAANLSMPQLIALGGTLDALAMPAEAGSTALAQFIAAIQRNMDGMAKAAHLATDEMRDLIANGKTFDAVQKLLSKVSDGTVSAQDLMDAMTGRSRTNVNIRSVITLLSNNMGLLNEQLRNAKIGFDSAFSNEISGNISLIANAMRTNAESLKTINGIDSSALSILTSNDTYMSINYLVSAIRNGMVDIDAFSKSLSGDNYDFDMIKSALTSVTTTVGELQKEGKMTAEVFEAMSSSSVSTLSVMEKEFARVNESAAGQFKRLGNSIRETFINSGTVTFFESVGKGLMNMIEWMRSGQEAAQWFNGVLASMVIYLIAAKTRLQEMIFTDLVLWFKEAGAACMNFAKALRTAQGRAHLLEVSLGFLQKNWFALFLAGAAALIAYFKSATNETKRFEEATAKVKDELRQERKEAAMLFSQLKNLNLTEAERSRLMSDINSKYGSLLGFMIDEKTTAGELANAYELVNAKLREKSNLQLQQKLLDESTKSGDEKIVSGYTSLASASDDYFGLLGRSKGKPEETIQMSADFQTKAIAAIESEIIRDSGRSTELILDNVLEKVLKQTPWLNRLEKGSNIYKALKDITEGMKENSKATERVANYMSGVSIGDQAVSDEAYLKRSTELAKKYNDNLPKLNYNPKQLSSDFLERAFSDINSLLKDESARDALTRQGRENALAQWEYWSKKISEEITRRNSIDPWGYEGQTLEEKSAEWLAKYHKQLEAAAVSIREGMDYSKIFPDIAELTAGLTKEEVKDALDKEDERVQEILKTKHFNVSPTFQHPNENSASRRNREKRELQDEMNAYIQELDEYFERRKELIEMNRDRENITEEEFNRQIEANDMKHFDYRIKLRNMYLQRSRGLSQAEMDEINTIVDDEGTLFTKEGIENTGRKLSKFGGALRQGISLQTQKDATSIQKVLLKHKKAMEDALLEGDFTGKVRKEWKQIFDGIGMLFSREEMKLSMATEQAGTQRIHILQEIARDAYKIDEHGLKERLKKHEEFSSWINDLGENERETAFENARKSGKDIAEATRIGLDAQKDAEEQTLAVMLQKLRDFNTAYIDSVQKSANKLKGLAQEQWDNDTNKTIRRSYGHGDVRDESMSSKDFWNTRISYAESNAALSKMFEGMDYIGGQDITDDAELRLYQLKVEASQEWINQLRKEIEQEEAKADSRVQNAHKELDELKSAHASRQHIEAAQAEYDNARAEREDLEIKRKLMLKDATDEWQSAMKDYLYKQSEDLNRTAEKMKMYYDELNNFAYEFGQNVFGSKEDRQNAAKELLVSVMTTSEKIIQQWLVQLSTRKWVNEAEILQEEAKATRLLAINAQLTGKTLMLHGTEVEAAVALNSAEATSKEAAKKGWIGLAVGAAIAAALQLLLGTAMSRVNKAKNEVSAIAGSRNGRLTSGMLTYAEGNYPVLGNDGRVYNAKYEKKLSTGVYSGPRFGIFSEKKPEAVIDGETTQKLLLDYPAIWKSILTIAQNGRLVNGGGAAMATHAAGTLEEITRAYTEGQVSQSVIADSNQNGELTAVLQQLMVVLTSGQIKTSIDMHGKDGLRSQLKRADRFMSKRKLG